MACQNRCSCISCHREITMNNFKKHSANCVGDKSCEQSVNFCKYCNCSFSGFTGIDRRTHLRWCNKNPNYEKYVNNAKENLVKVNAHKKLIGTGNNQFTKAKKAGNHIVVSSATKLKMSIALKGKGLSDEHKSAISEGRKLYLRNNPSKHPWKNTCKFISKPCEKLKSLMRDKGIAFIEEHQPLKDRFFSIDVYLPDINVGLEINGNQHYANGKLKDYYQERHELIEATGIILVEIPYDAVYSDRIIKLIDALTAIVKN